MQQLQGQKKLVTLQFMKTTANRQNTGKLNIFIHLTASAEHSISFPKMAKDWPNLILTAFTGQDAWVQHDWPGLGSNKHIYLSNWISSS